ncbi:hypothetical protein PMAYCL1PPCAC_24355, partial [Pristionchus mayeri]
VGVRVSMGVRSLPVLCILVCLSVVAFPSKQLHLCRAAFERRCSECSEEEASFVIARMGMTRNGREGDTRKRRKRGEERKDSSLLPSSEMDKDARLVLGSTTSSYRSSRRRSNCLLTLLSIIAILGVAILLAAVGLYLKSQQGGGLEGVWKGLSGEKKTEEPKEPPEIEETTENKEYLRKLVKAVNDEPSLGWKAKFNKFGVKNKSYGFKYTRNETEVRKYMEHLKRYFNSEKMKRHLADIHSLSTSSLPTHFDARLKWAHCPSISDVPNQGGCGSCYAVASMGVASDRACIASNGSFVSLLSPQDVLGCCSVCGNCFGGDPLKALTYWVEEGIVTGGRDGCRPYEFDHSCGVPCSPGTFRKSEGDRVCKRQCQSIYYQNDYDADKHFASIAYSMYPRSMTMDAAGTIREQVPSIIGHLNSTSPTPFSLGEIRTILKKELYLSGPFTMAFPVTEEFLHYHSGVFVPHPMEDFLSRVVYWHVVKVIGWGQDETGSHYWLAVNSFGRNWGDNGVFKINTDSMEKFGLEYETALA